MKARRVEIPHNAKKWRGQVEFFELDPPVAFTGDGDEEKAASYVVASSVVLGHSTDAACCEETMIFPANANGEALSWMELGARRRMHAGAEILMALGYEVVA